MRDIYFTIKECKADELEELKMSLFYNYEDFKEDFTEKEYNVLENCESHLDIPFSILKKFYGGYSFVEEDFFCNMENNYEDLILEQNNGLI